MQRLHLPYQAGASVSSEGYFRLAMAVIAQAMDDAKHGPPERRAQAQRDIADGGLDQWVDAVSIERGVHGRITALLKRIADQDEPLPTGR